AARGLRAADPRLPARRRNPLHAWRRGRGQLELDRSHRERLAGPTGARLPQLRCGHLGAGGGRPADRRGRAGLEAAMGSSGGREELEQFQRGEAIEVPVPRIESELAQLWRRAAEARPGELPKAVTRACLWNLVLRVEGDAAFAACKRLIDEVSQRIS